MYVKFWGGGCFVLQLVSLTFISSFVFFPSECWCVACLVTQWVSNHICIYMLFFFLPPPTRLAPMGAFPMGEINVLWYCSKMWLHFMGPTSCLFCCKLLKPPNDTTDLQDTGPSPRPRQIWENYVGEKMAQVATYLHTVYEGTNLKKQLKSKEIYLKSYTKCGVIY